MGRIIAGLRRSICGPTSYGTYNLIAGVLNAEQLDVGYFFGTGTFNQSGGTASITDYLCVGQSGAGTLNLSGGSMAVGSVAYVGLNAEGTIDQTGGQITIDDNLYVTGDGQDGAGLTGSGSYQLSNGGELSAANVFVGYSGDGSFSVDDAQVHAGFFAINGPSGSVGTLSVTDGGQLLLSQNGGQVVNVVKPSLGAVVASEGTSFNLPLVATTNVGDNAITSWNIAWGDQSANTYLNSDPLPASTPHTYVLGGQYYTVNATASGGGQNYPASSSIYVTDVPATMAAIADQQNSAGATTSISTSFTDPGVTETHTATVDWGDGQTTAALVTENHGSGTLNASHVYTLAGNYTPIVQITDSGGAVGVGSFNVSVSAVTPTITTPATAIVSPAGTSIALNALGSDPASGRDLNYTWTTTSSPAGATAPTFTDNGDNTAQNTTATIAAPGSYTFQVTIANPAGPSITSTVSVTVAQIPTALTLSPQTLSLSPGGTQQFTATATDQFGNAISASGVTWSSVWTGGTSDDGSMTAAGLYTASTDQLGAHTLTATDGSAAATATIAVADPAPTIATPAAGTVSTDGKSIALSVLGADDLGESGLTYTWAVTSTPAGATMPTFSDNADNTAKTTTATITGAGDYSFGVTITNASGQSVTSDADVTVNQIPASMNVSPSSVTVAAGASQQFTASIVDQFGNAMSASGISWSITSPDAGSIDSSGNYTAPMDNDGAFTIGASLGSAAAFATANVTAPPPSITDPASYSQVSPTTIRLTMSASSLNSLSYSWEVAGQPSGQAAPSFDDDSEQTTSVTLAAAGSYTFEGTATDETTGLSTTSNVTVNIAQVATSISGFSQYPEVQLGKVTYFVATELDQFGKAMAAQPGFSWTIDNPLIATIATSNSNTAEATVTASNLDTGEATVTASAGDVSGSFPVFVSGASIYPESSTSEGETVSTQNPLVTFSSPDGGTIQCTSAGTWQVSAANPSASSEEIDATFSEPVNDISFGWLSVFGINSNITSGSVSLSSGSNFDGTLAFNRNTGLQWAGYVSLSAYVGVTSIQITYYNAASSTASATIEGFTFAPVAIGITGDRTGGHFGQMVSLPVQNGGDPSDYVTLVNDNYDQNLSSGLADNTAATAPIQNDKMELNSDGTPVDPDFGKLTLWAPLPVPNYLGSGTFTLSCSDPSALQFFIGDGTELNNFTVNLASPSGDLAALATGQMDVWFEGLKADPDEVITLTYTDASGNVIAQDSIHMDIVEWTFTNPNGDAINVAPSLPSQLLLDTASGDADPTDLVNDAPFNVQLTGLTSDDVTGFELNSTSTTDSLQESAVDSNGGSDGDGDESSDEVSMQNPVVLYNSPTDPNAILSGSDADEISDELGFDVLHNGGAVVSWTSQMDSFTRTILGIRADIDPEAREFNYSTQTYQGTPLSDLTGPGNLNSVVNPAAIIIPQTGTTPTTSTASLIETTCLENIPGMTTNGVDNSKNLPIGDPRIVWSVESGPGQVSFLPTTQDPNGNQGPFVYVYGTTAGRVLLEASYKIPNSDILVPLAEYEALVTPLHTLKYRVQLVTDTNGNGTNVVPQQALQQVQVANELLYQIGVKLIPDTSGSTSDGAVAAGQNYPGIFRVGNEPPSDVNNVPTSLTNDTAANAAAALNEVDQVINIVYINSIGMDAKGNGTDWGLVVNTPGSTQSSVTLNYMLQVGQGSTSHTMNLIKGQAGTGGIHIGNWSMLLGNITPADYAISPDTENFPTAFMGNTIAHEVGHILGFLHRGTQQNTGAGDPFVVDGLPYDPSNVMLAITPQGGHALYSDDFDLAQAYAVQYSNAVTQSPS